MACVSSTLTVSDSSALLTIPTVSALLECVKVIGVIGPKSWEAHETGGASVATWADYATGGANPTTWADLET